MRVICFGDSNTYGYDPRSYFGDRYPEEKRWVDLLKGRTKWDILNAGANGREIPRYPYTLQQICHSWNENKSMDYLVVMLGSNDLLQGADVSTVAKRMEAFLSQIPCEPEKILLVAPPPMKLGEWVQEESLVHSSKKLAYWYQISAKKLGCHFADAGQWEIDLTFDGVHFSEEGHKAFADGMYKTFMSL